VYDTTVRWPKLHHIVRKTWPEPEVALTLQFPVGTTERQVLDFVEALQDAVQIAREDLGWSQ